MKTCSQSGRELIWLKNALSNKKILSDKEKINIEWTRRAVLGLQGRPVKIEHDRGTGIEYMIIDYDLPLRGNRAN